MKKKKLGLPGIDIEAAAEKNAMMAGECKPRKSLEHIFSDYLPKQLLLHFLGEFEVIMELLEAYKEGNQAKVAKAQVRIRFRCSSYFSKHACLT